MSFWKKKDNLIITSLVIAFFIGLTVWYDLCCVNASFFPASTSMNSFQIPFIDENQKELTLDRFKGKPLILNFWATWCPPCRQEMPEFNEANKVFEENGDAVLSTVNLTTGGARGETEDKVRKFMADNGYNMKVLLDKTGKVAEKYKIYAIPTTYVIDGDGRVYTYFEGTTSKDKLMKVYEELRK